MKNWPWLLVTLVIIISDQISKIWAVSSLVYAYPRSIMPMVNLTLAYNRGAAFSFLGSASGWQRWFFVGVSTVVSLILVLWLDRLPEKYKLQAMAVSCILGGAIGNLIDRAYSGAVVDFIDIFYKTHHWPTFNIADSFICIGAFLLLFDMVKNPQPGS